MVTLWLGQVVVEATSNVHWKHHAVATLIYLIVLVIVVRFLILATGRGCGRRCRWCSRGCRRRGGRAAMLSSLLRIMCLLLFSFLGVMGFLFFSLFRLLCRVLSRLLSVMRLSCWGW